MHSRDCGSCKIKKDAGEVCQIGNGQQQQGLPDGPLAAGAGLWLIQTPCASNGLVSFLQDTARRELLSFC